VSKRLFLVANTTIHELYGRNLLVNLESAGFEVTHILIPDGEKWKTLETVEKIYTYLLAQRADRNSNLVALGGGVTGDIVGFVAATYMRGIPYLQIPTTLLAQVDSSVGGKTGVNHRLGKNLIGAFYQPSLVLIDTHSLSTLPEREFKSGLYEVVKYGLIFDKSFFAYIAENLDSIKRREPMVLEQLISRCCEIKAEVISIDETETDLRRILNFGHTLGHALEAATRYEKLKHGEAVAYGMMAATVLSREAGFLEEEECERVLQTIMAIGPLPPVGTVSFREMLEAVKRDKKRQEDQTVFVLLRDIGGTVIRSGFSDERLESVWRSTLACFGD
jgi:3-dehydroquinate synthase